MFLDRKQPFSYVSFIMKFVAKFLFILIAFSLPNLINIDVRANAEDSIYISEINYAGSMDCNAVGRGATCANDKWIEIYNPSSEAVNLNQWTISMGRDLGSTNLNRVIPNISIQPKSYKILVNSDSRITSTLELSNTNYAKLSSLYYISGNTSGDKYIGVGLKNTVGVIIDQKSLVNTEIQQLEASKSQDAKHSIYFESKNGAAKLSTTSSYYPNNYGTPGTGSAFTQQPVTSPISETNTVTAPVITSNPTIQNNISGATEIASTESIPAQAKPNPNFISQKKEFVNKIAVPVKQKPINRSVVKKVPTPVVIAVQTPKIEIVQTPTVENIQLVTPPQINYAQRNVYTLPKSQTAEAMIPSIAKISSIPSPSFNQNLLYLGLANIAFIVIQNTGRKVKLLALTTISNFYLKLQTD